VVISGGRTPGQAAKPQGALLPGRDLLVSLLAKNYVVICDTNTFLQNDATVNSFLKNVVDAHTETNRNIVVPAVVLEELKKISNKYPAKWRGKRAAVSWRTIAGLINNRCGFECRGEKEELADAFADPVLEKIVPMLKLRFDLAFITADQDLAVALLSSVNDRAVQSSKKILVYQVAANGFMQELKLIPLGKASSGWGSLGGGSAASSCGRASTFRFDNPSSCRVAPDRLLGGNDAVIGVGACVYTSTHQCLRLLTSLGKGGEGEVFSTNQPNSVAKVYSPAARTQNREKKVDSYLQHGITNDSFCFPSAKLCDSRGRFLGYLMPKAEGYELAKSIFIKPLLASKFPAWNRRDLVQSAITILKGIRFCHERNIFLGDINPSNILVKNPLEVHFVDTDSYQINGLACPVGTALFTAPEIQEKHFKDFLRSEGNEDFAVAVLLFEILMLGKQPYATSNSDDIIRNIKNGMFPYPFGDRSSSGIPDGPWRFMWSHLPYRIKGAFYQTFAKGGLYFQPSSRLTAAKWIDLFAEYLRLLDDGSLIRQDSMSLDLYPTRYKQVTGGSFSYDARL
jgi:serine/threonine protein kinase/rRNA-processing protein FCF1